MANKLEGELIGLDLGLSNTGVARINTLAKLSEALSPIDMKNGTMLHQLTELIQTNNAVCIVVGLPRNLKGEETEQTRWAESIAKEIESVVAIPVFRIDEAVSTRIAESRARNHESVDSVAACIILEDFISELQRGNIDGFSL